MNGIIMLFVYAAIMILATVTMTKKEKNVRVRKLLTHGAQAKIRLCLERYARKLVSIRASL